MIDIAKEMTRVLPALNEGLEGYRCHLEPSCADEWSERYVRLVGLWFETPEYEDGL